MQLEAIAFDWDTPSWTDVEAHRYRPPDGFIEAVRVCPIRGTEEYGKAIFALVDLLDLSALSTRSEPRVPRFAFASQADERDAGAIV